METILWEQQDRAGAVIEVFYQGPRPNGKRARPLIADSFNNMEIGESRGFTGQTVLVRTT